MRSIFIGCLLLSATFLLGQTHFYIANRDGNNILRYTMEGVFVEEFVTAGLGGLNNPQEVLFHPVDGSLLVTGFNNPQIKRYDSESGDFLGDFSNNYNLAQPTKMLVGPDSLIYVTQWGSTQNKIVRFDFAGNFVDEWSAIDVPEGCGMTWDAEGNMLVTTWSNGLNNGTQGFVRKLDPQGNDLGILVNTSILQGPVGIWTDANEDLFVIDWTLGRVIQFDKEGNFIGNFISGMTRTEGNAVGPDGKYYLCDWQQNRVMRYNSDGSLDKVLVSGGFLNIPNSISFGPDGMVNAQEEISVANQSLALSPNPAGTTLQVEYTLGTKKPLHLNCYNTLGQLVWSQKVTVATSAPQSLTLDVSQLITGSYQVVLSDGQNSWRRTFIKL